MGCVLLKDLIGCKIVSTYALKFQWEGSLTDAVNSVWVRCESDVGVRISGCPDGENVRCDHEFDWPVDMGEAGAVVLVELAGPWSVLKKKRLVKVYGVCERGQDTLIGIGLEVEGERPVYILNLGDELVLFGAVPEHILAEDSGDLEIRLLYEEVEKWGQERMALPSREAGL